MTKRQWIVLMVLIGALAVSIALRDVWIQPDAMALRLHLGILCVLAIVGWFMLRYLRKWKYFEIFNSALGAAAFWMLAVQIWREGSYLVGVFNGVAAVSFTVGIFSELHKLKRHAGEHGGESHV